MYRFTFLICVFMIYVNCILSASPVLLSAASAVPALNERQHETGSTTYDQKQSGKYNIHLNIKDVAIIALDSGNTDSDGDGDSGEDYYVDYDLSDFTVKPIFSLIDGGTTEQPSSTTATPPPALIHFETDSNSNFLHQNNNSTNKFTTEESIIKHPIINKTQSVMILNDDPLIVLGDSGVVVTTPGNIKLQTTTDKHHANNTKQSYKPNEIPVHIVIEPTRPTQMQSGRKEMNSEWRLKNRIRATPSNVRRITPPRFENAERSELSLKTNRKHNKHIRNCGVDRNGRCQNSLRFRSPTMNGILSLLSLLMPREAGDSD